MPNDKPEGRTPSKSWSATALRAALAITKSWGLTDTQAATLLGAPGAETLEAWKREAAGGQVTLPKATVETLGLLIGSYRTLSTLFRSDAEILDWLATPHFGSSFQGRPPMMLLTDGGSDGLWRLRIHVDAWATSTGAVGTGGGPPGEADIRYRPLADSRPAVQ